MTTPKLKPCPFCGRTPELGKCIIKGWSIHCFHCEKEFELTAYVWAKTKTKAIGVWNGRARAEGLFKKTPKSKIRKHAISKGKIKKKDGEEK